MEVRQVWYPTPPNEKDLKNNAFFKDGFFDRQFAAVAFSKSEFNSFGFRSDEFTSNHDGLHVVFTGCSTTMGTALEKEYLWAKLLYDKIFSETPCSGYFNLGINGTSMMDQTFNLFKYFKKYGNPNVIFFNMPEALRFYYDKNGEIHHAWYDDKEVNLLFYLGYQYYLMLESYCITNNIQLYGFTWNPERFPKSYSNFFTGKFKTFYPIPWSEREQFVFDYAEKLKGQDYLLKAKDGIHHGIAHHQYFFNFMYKHYKQKNFL